MNEQNPTDPGVESGRHPAMPKTLGELMINALADALSPQNKANTAQECPAVESSKKTIPKHQRIQHVAAFQWIAS